jgi:hypothetical protein
MIMAVIVLTQYDKQVIIVRSIKIIESNNFYDAKACIQNQDGQTIGTYEKKETYKTINREIFNLICESAYYGYDIGYCVTDAEKRIDENIKQEERRRQLDLTRILGDNYNK